MKSFATVVGRNVDISGYGLHLIDKNQRILILRSNNHIGLNTVLRQPLDLRIDRGRSHTSCYEQNLLAAQNFGILLHKIRRTAQRTCKIGQLIADVHRTQFFRRKTDRLRHDGHPTFLRIVIGYRQRNTLSLLVKPHDDKLSGFG